jgi:hypothetical protein
MDRTTNQFSWYIEIYTFIINIDILFLDNSLLCEYTNRVNNELLSSRNEETASFYNHVFRHMYKSILPLDYFSNELNTYIGILSHLSQWPALVRVGEKNFSSDF